MNNKLMFALLSFFVAHASYAANLPQKAPLQPIPITAPQINLNKAELSSLVGSLKGIGKKRAEAIIAYRESHQGFKSVEELAEVKGIGQKFVDLNKEKLHEIFLIQ